MTNIGTWQRDLVTAENSPGMEYQATDPKRRDPTAMSAAVYSQLGMVQTPGPGFVLRSRTRALEQGLQLDMETGFPGRSWDETSNAGDGARRPDRSKVHNVGRHTRLSTHNLGHKLTINNSGQHRQTQSVPLHRSRNSARTTAITHETHQSHSPSGGTHANGTHMSHAHRHTQTLHTNTLCTAHCTTNSLSTRNSAHRKTLDNVHTLEYKDPHANATLRRRRCAVDPACEFDSWSDRESGHKTRSTSRFTRSTSATRCKSGSRAGDSFQEPRRPKGASHGTPLAHSPKKHTLSLHHLENTVSPITTAVRGPCQAVSTHTSSSDNEKRVGSGRLCVCGKTSESER